MKKKKVYHLKTGFKVLIIFLVLIVIGVYFGIQKYQEYMYTKSLEYKFVQKGYTKKEFKILENKLDKSQLNKLLKQEYNEFLSSFVKEKYFIKNNLDIYLSQVKSRKDDFFGYVEKDEYDYAKIVAKVNVGAIRDFYEEMEKSDVTLGNKMLVNKYFDLDASYIPEDLVDIPWKYRLGLEAEKKTIKKEVLDAFIEMWESAKAEDIYLLVDSGYRSYESQAEVYKYYEDYKGTKYADGIAARPGSSEHQTGLTLDIYAKGSVSSTTFESSNAFKWLSANSYKYGFILRYPKDKESLTGYNYESWHYRYLGKDLAKKVYDSNLTYDEYYAFYIKK